MTHPLLTKIVDKPREQARLEDSEHESQSRHSSVVVDTTQAHGHDRPSQHQESNPLARAETFEEVVGRYFEDHIGDEKYHQGNGILVGRHMGLGKQVIVS